MVADFESLFKEGAFVCSRCQVEEHDERYLVENRVSDCRNCGAKNALEYRTSLGGQIQ